MGSFLDKPKTEKETIEGENNNLVWACSCMQGWRVEMEDAHTCVDSIPRQRDSAFFCVFDGHGGDLVANNSAERLLDKIQSLNAYINGDKGSECLKKCLYDGLIALDKDLRKLPEVAKGQDRSGATAITSFVTPTHIILGNTGDSRAVLCRAGKVYFGTTDHKPTDKEETERVQRAGGFIEMGRVCGNLAVSRALGDFQYKDRPDLSPEEQKITVAPDVTIIDRDEADSFLLLCCDGIWDVMSNDEACSFIESCLKGGLSAAQSCELLMDHCLNKDSKDNMSVLLVVFPNGPKKTEGCEPPQVSQPIEDEKDNSHRLSTANLKTQLAQLAQKEEEDNSIKDGEAP